MRAGDGRARAGRTHGAPAVGVRIPAIEANGARFDRLQPEDGANELGLAAADEAGDPCDLSGARSKADIDDRAGLHWIDIRAHSRDLPVGDRHVHGGIHLVAGIDDVSALEQDLITDLSAGIGDGLGSVTVDPAPMGWSIADLALQPGWAAAVAAQLAHFEVRRLTWEPTG